MPRKLTQVEFIKQCIDTHGNKYDYSSVVYNGKHIQVNIVCPDHGLFVKRPTDFITKKSGCPQCSSHGFLNLETFIQRSSIIHNYTYDYSLISEYINYETPLKILCKKHNIVFSQTPRTHLLQKCGCPVCAKEKMQVESDSRKPTINEFIIQAQKVHGTKFDYSKVVYKNSMKKVEIICPQHGSFFQTPNSHISKKQGCIKCFNKDKRGGLGGYSEGWFKLHPERVTLPAQVYVIHMQCATDNFIKVGITINTIKQRYSRSKVGDIHINKELIISKQLPLYEAFLTEQSILNTLKEYKYYPNYVFDGKTECLKYDQEVVFKIQAIINNENTENPINV